MAAGGSSLFVPLLGSWTNNKHVALQEDVPGSHGAQSSIWCPGDLKSKPVLPGGLRVQGVLGLQVVLEGPGKKEHKWVINVQQSSLPVPLSSEGGEGQGTQ